jgi:hypothetical protein
MKYHTMVLVLAILAGSDIALAEENDPFTVVKVVEGCHYFIAKTPAWYSVAEDWTCSMPSEGDSGQGDLMKYFATPVTLNGASCSLWVETWTGSEDTALQALSQYCGDKQ